MVGGHGILKHTCYATPHLTYRQTVQPFAEAPPGSCRCELILSHPTSTAPVFLGTPYPVEYVETSVEAARYHGSGVPVRAGSWAAS